MIDQDDLRYTKTPTHPRKTENDIMQRRVPAVQRRSPARSRVVSGAAALTSAQALTGAQTLPSCVEAVAVWRRRAGWRPTRGRSSTGGRRWLCGWESFGLEWRQQWKGLGAAGENFLEEDAMV
ncbi:hypothetical protein E3N88_28390 [Mikania micrantha]|uniref:Uncharacterized protein n=1 Tax=Mikania micrantha TaxID=192012 RepID=A0A5N6MZB3_9ASTR|nr:hypothetical protein E3N88_28390 [Mikania micrantha]